MRWPYIMLSMFSANSSHTKVKSGLPRPKDFSKALYSIDCGQNDLHYLVTTMTEDQAKAAIPNITNQFVQVIEVISSSQLYLNRGNLLATDMNFATQHAWLKWLFIRTFLLPLFRLLTSKLLQKLYQEGARKFWIHNTGPIGCLPLMVIYHSKSGDVDEIGCVKSYNEVAQEFNNQLKYRIYQLSCQLQGVELIYVDIYAAKYTLIREATNYGMFILFIYIKLVN